MKEKKVISKKYKLSIFESLIQKYMNAKGKDKALLLAIIKNKVPDFKE